MTDALPLAVGIAASPFPIIPVILLLLSAHALRNASGFLVGWVVGIGGSVTAFVLIADLVETNDEPAAWISWTRIVLGAALVVWGSTQWFRRPVRDQPPPWMSSLDDATFSSALRLGLVLSVVNPKVLLLSAAGGAAIGSAYVTPAATTVAALAFTAVAASTVALPVVVYALLRERVLAPLQIAKDWLTTNNAAVMAVIMVALGVILLTTGVSEL